MRPEASALVTEMAAFEGVAGCSVVEADTGMTWYHSGRMPDMESIGEAAIEFWRIQGRLSSQLAVLGSLQSVAYAFSNHVVALFPCSAEPRLVLICVAARGRVNWPAWSVQVPKLRQALASVLVSPQVTSAKTVL